MLDASKDLRSSSQSQAIWIDRGPASGRICDGCLTRRGGGHDYAVSLAA